MVNLRRSWRRGVVIAGLVAAAVAGTVEASPDSIGSGATSNAPATRGVAWNTTAECDIPTVTALAGRHPDVRQFVVLSTSAFGATWGQAFVAARLSTGEWVCQAGTSPARFGRSGTRPLFDRRSGDGTTPAGVFPLGEVTAWDGQRVNVFGNRPDPGVRSNVHYRAVRPEDCWGATPNQSDYNHLVARPGCAGPDDEWLPRFGDVYSHAAVIGANLDPISGDEPGEPPYAAAIFLHRHSYLSNGTTKATSGCVSLAYDQLVETITLLDPDLDPHFAIGPVDYLRTTA